MPRLRLEVQFHLSQCRCILSPRHIVYHRSVARSPRLSRRQLLGNIGKAAVLAPFSGALSAFGQAAAVKPAPSVKAPGSPFSPEDDQLLDELERLTCCYFFEQASTETGLVKDRCNARKAASDNGIVASIAATGFGLTALCIGDMRGYISRSEARDRVLTTLRFLHDKLPNHRGFFYHFANINTGERVWDSEISSIDTAILMCGILTCRTHFRDTDITLLAHSISNRVEWTWLSEDTSLLSHGWLPEVGFLPYRWDYYNEMMMMYLLGMGSPTYALRPEAWDAWKRIPFDYEGMRYIGSFAPLFVHQYSQAWFDFRGKRDKYADYFQNSITATRVHRRFCMELGRQFPDFGADLWGVTASDSPNGYVVWGGPPSTGPIDGTVAPHAAGGSLPFLPQETMQVLRNIRNRYPQTWSCYGFVDALNPLKNWYDTDVVGIDAGITMVMAENARTGYIWKVFMENPEAQRGMQLAGFKPYKAS
jgi:hypothetical protein